MIFKQILILGASLTVLLPIVASAQEGQYVQVAEIEIEPSQVDAYAAAVKEQIETAIRVEPGVLVLYAVAEKENSSRIRVFEVYRDTGAYRSHLETDHFKKYKAATEKMVKSLKLVVTTPISLGSK